MVVGLDTGFFILLMKENEHAIKVWHTFLDNRDNLIVSVLTIGELLYMSYRVRQPDAGQRLILGINQATEVIPVDQSLVEKAAGLKAGRGTPYVDAIILATFMMHNCEEIHTTDRNHFGEIKNKGLEFVFWDM